MATTTEQGYGWDHQRERARWVRYQDDGGDDGDGGLRCRADKCLMPSRWIEPGMPWDLGHYPGQQRHRGPEHVKCNRTAGAHASNLTGNPGASNPKPRQRRRPRADLVEVSVDVSSL